MDRGGKEHWDTPLVHVERRGVASIITLDSPRNRNALSRRLVEEVAAALERSVSSGARLVVLTGSGSTFCSGADLAERLHPPPGEEEVTFAAVLSAVVSCPVPVLARVNGHVRGGGMGLVAACDLAVAPAAATFAFTEVRVGVAPAVIAVPLLLRMAPRALAHRALTASRFSAEEAERAGLLTAVRTDLPEVDGWVEEVTAALAACAPAAVGATKGLLADLRGVPWDEAITEATALSERIFSSDEAAEGMRAFLEKRAPRWDSPSAPPGRHP